MKTKRTTDCSPLRAFLLSLLTLLILTPLTSAYASPGIDDWEWGDEWGEAYATCDDCGTTYMVTDCRSSSDAESELAPYFCEGCGRCSQYGNDECYSANHCFMCGDCLDGDYFGPIYEDMEVVVCDNCAYGNIDEFFPYFCSFCGMAYGVDVEPCDCGYQEIVEHCSDCCDVQCSSCGIALVIGGEDTPFLDDGCLEHELCFDCKKNDDEHCKECGSCDMEVCSECGLCEGCNAYEEHCPECGTCWGESGVIWCPEGGEHCASCCDENDWLCERCNKCTESTGLEKCDDCGYCEECCQEEADDAGCSHGYCIASSDYEDHLCLNCQKCPDDTECEYCGLCEDCQADYHCEHGLCPDGSEWDEHLCSDCGDCYEEDELCEFCGKCESCADGYHCDHGYCPDDVSFADDLDHFICEQCSDCYEGSDRCDDCGLCESCCQANTLAEGCDHAICVQSDEFAEHWCYADEQCLEKCNHNDCAHSRVTDEWETNGTAHWHVCRDCGTAVDKAIHVEGAPMTIVEPNAAMHKNGTANVSCSVCSEFMATISLPYVPIPEDGSPYIITQPKDYEGKVSDFTTEGDARFATFTVRAGGPNLKYQWYQSLSWTNASGSLQTQVKKLENLRGWTYDYYGKDDVSGATSNSLTIVVAGDACYNNYQYYCEITNANGKVETVHAKMNAKHVFGRYERSVYFDESYGATPDKHYYVCLGDGCLEAKASNHRFGEWKLVRAATSSATGLREQTCMDCDAKNSEVIPKVEAGHTHKFDQVHYNTTEHWYSCKCGVLSTAPKQAHLWDKTTIVTQPTEKRAGKKEISCSKCGITKTETIDKLPHTHQWYTLENIPSDKLWVKKAVTTQSGSTNYIFVPNESYWGRSSAQHYFKCKTCDEINASGHTWSFWSVTRRPSKTENGRIYHRCAICNMDEYKNFPEGTYPVMIVGGTANKDYAKFGETVTITYDPISAQYGFEDNTYSYPVRLKEWCNMKRYYGDNYIDYGGESMAVPLINFQDSKANTTTFTMFAGPAVVIASVEECKHNVGTTFNAQVEPTCTNYGHKPDKVCLGCGQVMVPGARIEALGHDLEDNPIAGTAKVEYCMKVGRTGPVANTATHGYAGDFKCKRCNKTVKGKDTPLKHGLSGRTESWNNTYANVYEWKDAVDATCTKDGKHDVYCKHCNKLVKRGEKVERLGHQWGAWTVARAASTTVKGMEEHICQRDASHRETRLTDYSGPDYRLKADKTKLAFEWTYGETPKGQTVTFSSIGRNDVTALKALQKIKGTPFFSVAFNGLKMTITPIADEVIKNASTRTINLATVTAGLTTVTDFSAPSVTLSFNVKKATPTFKFASAGKNAIIGDKTSSPKISGAADGMTFTYYSSDNSIAVVDATTGEVKGLKAGTVTITAKFAGNDHYTSFATSYTLTVTTPDAIDDLDADGAARTSAAKQGTYDLSGRKVEEMRRTDVYVKDGKKVSVKNK